LSSPDRKGTSDYKEGRKTGNQEKEKIEIMAQADLEVRF
jgi:hypothetical protein